MHPQGASRQTAVFEGSRTAQGKSRSSFLAALRIRELELRTKSGIARLALPALLVNHRIITFDAAVVSGDTSKVSVVRSDTLLSTSVRSQLPTRESRARKPVLGKRSRKASRESQLNVRTLYRRSRLHRRRAAGRGRLSRHRVKTKADYLVAGRSLPAFVLVLTLLTSWIGAGSLFAGAENAYKNGFAALWQPAGGWLGLLLIYFIAPRARKFAQFTLPDLLEARYNQAARVLGTIAILFAYVAITSYQFKGGGNVLHLIFPDTVTPEQGTYIIAAFVISPRPWPACRPSPIWMWPSARWSRSSASSPRPCCFVKAGGWAGLHAALPPTHFEVLGNLTLRARARVPRAHHAAHARQPGDVPEILLRKIRARRAHLRRRLDSGHCAA